MRKMHEMKQHTFNKILEKTSTRLCGSYICLGEIKESLVHYTNNAHEKKATFNDLTSDKLLKEYEAVKEIHKKLYYCMTEFNSVRRRLKL